MSEKDKIERFLTDYTFNTPAEITVLHDQESLDQDTRMRVRTLLLKSNEEYLPMSPRISDQADRVLGALKSTVSGYDFGVPVEGGASYFQWLSPTSEWKVSSLQTDKGHFSLWERRADVYQLTN